MSSYYSIQDQELLRTKSNVKGAVAIVFWCLSLWLYANQPNLFNIGPLLILATLLFAMVMWFFALADYSMSKGYSWAYGFLAAFGIIGLAVLLFMPDRYLDRESPKMKIRRMSW